MRRLVMTDYWITPFSLHTGGDGVVAAGSMTILCGVNYESNKESYYWGFNQTFPCKHPLLWSNQKASMHLKGEVLCAICYTTVIMLYVIQLVSGKKYWLWRKKENGKKLLWKEP